MKLTVEEIVILIENSEFEYPETGNKAFDHLGFARAVEKAVIDRITSADASKLDLIDSWIRRDGYAYLHNNRPQKLIGLHVGNNSNLRSVLDSWMDRNK